MEQIAQARRMETYPRVWRLLIALVDRVRVALEVGVGDVGGLDLRLQLGTRGRLLVEEVRARGILGIAFAEQLLNRQGDRKYRASRGESRGSGCERAGVERAASKTDTLLEASDGEQVSGAHLDGFRRSSEE